MSRESYSDIQRSAIDDLHDAIRSKLDELGRFSDMDGDIFEIADSATPIYTSDIFHILANNLNIAGRDVESGDGDLISIAQRVIFDQIQEDLWSESNDLEKEWERLVYSPDEVTGPDDGDQFGIFEFLDRYWVTEYWSGRVLKGFETYADAGEYIRYQIEKLGPEKDEV